MPAYVRPEPGPAARAAQLEAEERAFLRRVRARRLGQVVGCLVSCVAGLYLLALSLHLTDPDLAEVAFWSGLLVGNVGVLATLLVAYHDAERRGDR